MNNSPIKNKIWFSKMKKTTTPSWFPSIFFSTSLLVMLATALSLQAAENQGVIDLNMAVANTLTDNPSLRAMGYQMQAQDARILQAGIKPAPQLNVELENVLGTGDNNLFESAQTTVSVAWVLERGVRERQVDAARAGTSVVESELNIKRLDEAAETARRYLLCLLLQTRMTNARGGITLAEEAVAAIQRRVEAGTAFNAELSRARAELARRELTLEDIEHELLSAYYRLGAQWGESEPSFSRVVGDLFEVPEVESFASLKSQLDENPDLTQFLSQQRLNEAQLRLEESRNKQSWRVSAGLRRLEVTSDQAFVAGFTIPLGRQNNNRGRVEEARSNIARTEMEAVAERVRLETELFVIYQELQHSIQLTEALRIEILPLYEQALEETQNAYDLGRYSYLEWNAAQSELLAARYDLIDASMGIFQNLIEIERITGVSVEVTQFSQ